MSDDLYDSDALAWSECQAALLRRAARGERVNDLDWPHIIEEIEDVGLSQLRAVRSLLRQSMVHLLRLHGWPDCEAADHWRREIRRFLIDAADGVTPAMRQRIDLAILWRQARAQVAPDRYDGREPRPLPDSCPFTLNDVLTVTPDVAALEARLSAASVSR